MIRLLDVSETLSTTRHDAAVNNVSPGDVHKPQPIDDPEVYRRAYAEADLAGRLAEIVHRLRTNAGLTQTELARRMGTTQSSIARVEHGGSTPTLDLLDRLGRAINTQITLTVNGETMHFGAPSPEDRPSHERQD